MSDVYTARIVIEGNAESIQPTVDKLKELGAVDEQNAAQFKKNNAEYLSLSAKKSLALEREKKDLEFLEAQRKKAYNPETIKSLDQSIKKTQENVRLLSSELNGASKSMGAVVINTEKLTAVAKSGFSALRTLANVLPGIGISGLIFAGYEALSRIIDGIGDSIYKLRTEDLQFNTQHLESMNEIISKEKELNDELKKRAILLEIDAKTATQADLERYKLANENQKELQKIADEFIKKADGVPHPSLLAGTDDKTLQENIKRSDKYYEDLALIELDKQGKLLYQQKIYETKLSEIKDDEGRRRNKLIQDMSVQELENHKKSVEAQLKIDQLAAKENITDTLELNKELYDLSEKRDIEILYLNEEIAKKKRNQDVKVANATITDRDELNNRLYNIELAYNDKISGLRADFYENSRAADAQYYSTVLADLDKAEAENNKEVQKDKDRRKEDIKTNEQRLADVLALQNIKNLNAKKITEDQFDKQSIKDHLAVLELKKTNLEEYSNEYIEIEIKEQELLKQLREKEKKERKKDAQDQIDNLKQIYEYAIQINEDRIKASIDAIDRQEALQKDAIDVQRRQAELGHANTLAFEEKRAADLERDRMKEQKKLIKLKELETFLNSIAAFSKDDPQSAVAKALAELAIVKGVEATFMEEGGILGKGNDKSLLSLSGLSKRHKSGKDILVHGEVGEGMLSTKEVSNLGGEQAFMDFKKLLSVPLNLPEIPMTGVMFQGMNTKRLEDKLDQMKEAIDNMPGFNVDWESRDGMEFRNETRILKGVRETVSHQIKRPRI